MLQRVSKVLGALSVGLLLGGWGTLPDDKIAKLPDALPKLSSPLGGACRITSGYGTRVHPLMGEVRSHLAVDFVPTKEGVALRAPADGYIEEVNSDHGRSVPHGNGYSVVSEGREDACGNWVMIRVAKTKLIQMCHMQNEAMSKGINQIFPGMKVAAGQALGKMGSTGMSTGPHVHFIIWEEVTDKDGKVRSLSDGTGRTVRGRRAINPTKQVKAFCGIAGADPADDEENQSRRRTVTPRSTTE